MGKLWILTLNVRNSDLHFYVIKAFNVFLVLLSTDEGTLTFDCFVLCTLKYKNLLFFSSELEADLYD